MRRLKSQLMLVLLGLTICLVAGLAIPKEVAALEAKMYVVTRWNAGCGGSPRSRWDDMVDAWYDEITFQGFGYWGICWWGHCGDAYSRDGRQKNGNIVNSQFADASIVSWGRDSRHLDEGDAVMVGWHGDDDNGVWVGSMRVNETGPGDCSLRRDEMEIGDSDLEFLHLSSCHSMDDNMWSNWWRAFRGAHQVDGFHGLMWIGSSLVSDYEDFADDAFSSTIADAWLDNMYHNNISGNDDQCPVAYVVGRNASMTWLRIGTERYNRVHSDPTTIGYWGVIFISGCDPAGETVINSDRSN